MDSPCLAVTTADHTPDQAAAVAQDALRQADLAAPVSLDQIAARYRVTARRFRRLVDEAGVPHIIVGKRLRFYVADVDAHFRSRSAPPPDPGENATPA